MDPLTDGIRRFEVILEAFLKHRPSVGQNGWL